MRIELRAEGLVPAAKLRAYVERRVGFALATFAEEIDAVQVRLADVNEALQGRDRSCRVQVSFGGRFEAVVESMDTDLHVAIHRAADRAGWTVSRKLQRERREAIDARHRMFAGRQPLDQRGPERAA